MILIVIDRPPASIRVIRKMLPMLRASGQDYLITRTNQLSMIYENTGKVKLYRPGSGRFAPKVIFHCVRSPRAGEILDTLSSAGFRLVNPVAAWRAGSNKAVQLGAFEQHGIPHPWSLFSRGSWRQARSLVSWRRGLYILKPHDAGRGQEVSRVKGGRRAQRIFARLRRSRGVALVQSYVTPKKARRFHYRVNVVDQSFTRCR
ncbi:MAG: hypothetical protein WD535_03490 [Thermaerobacterales bacterium]